MSKSDEFQIETKMHKFCELVINLKMGLNFVAKISLFRVRREIFGVEMPRKKIKASFAKTILHDKIRNLDILKGNPDHEC